MFNPPRIGLKPFTLWILVLIVLHSSLMLVPSKTYSQRGILSGYVKDSTNKHLLAGVNVVLNSETGTSTDLNGFYELEIEPGEHQLVFSIIGYKTIQKKIIIEPGENEFLDILLPRVSVELDMAVITASRFEQRLADVSVSIGVMKPAFIESINTIAIDKTLDYMPGIDIMDGQASIRGGSGYSYGAGSRVLVLVDDLPLLTASDGDVKWNYLPVENIAQVEVLKGAASAMYGSSALNGIVNIRTAYPETKPRTNISLYSGFVNTPEREEMAWWWDTYPIFSGASFSHSQKIKDVDIVAGANGLIDPGYRKANYDERIRMNFKLRHSPTSVKGLLYGFNTNFQWQHISDFFIWVDADSGAFLQNQDVITPTQGIRINVDPWVSYFDKSQNKHALKMRYYRVTNDFKDDPDKNNSSDLYYGEYQFHRVIKSKLNLTAGFSGLAGKTRAELYGDHFNSTISLFTQLEYKFFNKLSASIGLRWERYTLDDTDRESGVVTRAGLNYQVAKATFIRASYGQGYRFPSIAEKYTATSLGSLNIFPNPDLKSETGWSSELGIRQGLMLKSWTGFIDAAFFWTEYNDMIEFTFGIYKPDTADIPSLKDIGFKSLNVGKARITGFEIGITGNGEIGKTSMNLFAGYTYMNPVDMSSDTLSNNILKYRYRHSLKGDVSVEIKRLSMGLSVVYRSFVERIDLAFEEKILGQEIFPGLKEYRQ